MRRSTDVTTGRRVGERCNAALSRSARAACGRAAALWLVAAARRETAAAAARRQRQDERRAAQDAAKKSNRAACDDVAALSSQLSVYFSCGSASAIATVNRDRAARTFAVGLSLVGRSSAAGRLDGRQPPRRARRRPTDAQRASDRVALLVAGLHKALESPQLASICPSSPRRMAVGCGAPATRQFYGHILLFFVIVEL